MKKALIARSDHDDGTRYLYEWSGLIIKEAQAKGYKVADVKGKEVNSKEVIGKIKSMKPIFVFLNGHGDENSYCGQNFEEIINKENSTVLENTITYVRACDCLEGLGGEAVKNGCKAFIGYKMKFIVPMQDEYVSRPLQDPMAKPVMEASNIVAKSVVEGKSAKEAVDIAHNLARKYIRELLFSKKFSQDIYSNPTFEALVINNLGLGFTGNGDSLIS